MTLLRRDLLAGRRVALLAQPDEVLRPALLKLGARVEVPAALADEDDHVGEWARSRAPLDALVYSARGAFGAGGGAGLRASLEQAWMAVREVATGAMIGVERPGKLLLIAPRPDAGPLARAARAGLENLVRTLSVEWARYGLTAALIVPGGRTSDEEIAALSCFLVSEAGDYVSGCRLELGQMT
jgi:NAD(P)-dependent dehydrogenase (short-subunit alcohol dehydrogenase family)